MRGVDLSERGERAGRARVAGATFLGCTFGPGVDERLEAAGALVLPALTIVPVDVYRSRLYTAESSTTPTPYRRSLDARAYAWSQTPRRRRTTCWPGRCTTTRSTTRWPRGSRAGAWSA